jgi:FkbM family methyltransferase
MFHRITASIGYRTKWAKLGVYYFRHLRSIRSIRVGGKRIDLSFPESERGVLEYKLGRILLDDCYRLAEIRYPIQSVVDIGANVGLFSIAARRYFPNAIIHCYEPNPSILPHLISNCSAIDVNVHQAAIGDKEGWASLELSENSLHTVSNNDDCGPIPIESFAQIAATIGSIDLLKLDCEHTCPN